MFNILMFIIIFAVVYTVYHFIYEDKLKKEKYTKIAELVLLSNKFKLDKTKMDKKKLLNGVALINAFIISVTFTIVDILPIKNIALKLILAFVIILVLIFTLYLSYGKQIQKKWGKQDGK